MTHDEAVYLHWIYLLSGTSGKNSNQDLLSADIITKI